MFEIVCHSPTPPLRQTWHQAALFPTHHPFGNSRLSTLRSAFAPEPSRGPSLSGAFTDQVTILAKDLNYKKAHPNPTLFLSSSGDEPCSPGQWDTTSRATPHPRG